MTHNDFNGSKLIDVRIDKMFEPEYQRELSPDWVDQLASGWNSHLFRFPTLSKRDDGRYARLDGNHTIEAAMERGHLTVPCIVYEDLSLKEEARMFSELNDQRRKPQAYDLYVSGVIGEEPWALALKDLAAEYDLTVCNGGQGPDRLRSVGAMRELFKSGQWDIAKEALAVLTSAYPADGMFNSTRTERAYVLGMADLIRRAKRDGLYDRALFVRKLQRATFRFQGNSISVTPDGFETYLNNLIASGKMVVTSFISNSAPKTYGNAFALAILGQQAAILY